MEDTKDKLEALSEKLYLEDSANENTEEDLVLTSPTSKLLLKTKKKSSVFSSPIQEEFSRYESMARLNRKAANQVNIHENLPKCLLSNFKCTICTMSHILKRRLHYIYRLQ